MTFASLKTVVNVTPGISSAATANLAANNMICFCFIKPQEANSNN
jgi:hypothetical protein